jgi:hypothetical protein
LEALQKYEEMGAFHIFAKDRTQNNPCKTIPLKTYFVKLFMQMFMGILYSISHMACKQFCKTTSIMSHDNFTKDLIARLESRQNIP